MAIVAFVAYAGHARAEELRAHALAGAAHALGAPQSSELGFGGGGAVGVELPLAKVVGAQAMLGGVALAPGSPPADPSFAPRSTGTGLLGMAGARVRPLASRGPAGPWIDADIGVAGTGASGRFAFDAHIGWDWRVGGGRIDLGPFVGYTQIVQPDSAVRPEDARIAWLGLHVGLGATRSTTSPVRADAPPAAPPAPVRRDSDVDGVVDAEDACPQASGVRTPDPRTNGCPRADRDNDGIFDDEDACPDVPGVRTGEAATNGCPASAGPVRVEKDRIVLDDVIHFERDSARVRHVSWALVQKLAEFINANPDVLEVDIEGHADAVGTSEHNQYISAERAEAVKRLLVHYGVAAERLTAHAYGESRPRVTGRAEDQLRQNRRVEFTITRVRPATSPPAPAPDPQGAP